MLKQHVGHIKGNVSKCLKSTKEKQDKCRKSIEEAQAKKKAKKSREKEVRIKWSLKKRVMIMKELEQVGGLTPRKLGPIDKFVCPIDSFITLSENKTGNKILMRHFGKIEL